MKQRLFVFILLLTLCAGLYAQPKTDSLFTTAEDSLLLEEIPEYPDSAFALAREYAFNSKLKKAEKILQFNVLRYPNNTDYSIFLARVYSWQRKFDESKAILHPILEKDTAQMEAYRLLTQVERFQKNYDTSLVMSNKGLEWVPNDEFFFVNKAQSETGLIKFKDALETVDTALGLYPNNNELKQLRVFLLNQLIASGLAVGLSVDYFTENVYDTWYSGFIQYGFFTSAGPVIPRVNIANRFLTTGVQFEIDAYPQLGGGRYLYLNAGYSESNIFPQFRFGGEFYTGIPNSSFEVSLGIRYLYFTPDASATLYTGSIGVYYRNAFWQFRPFIIDDNSGDYGSSYNIMYRRFFTKGGFFQASAGFGFIPDQRIIQIGGTTGEDQYILESQTVALAYQKPLGNRSFIRLDASFTNQEKFNVPEHFFNTYSGAIAFGLRF
jgi:YaiO family outer membrane protein